VTLIAVVGLKREARLVQAAGVRVVIGGGRSDLLEARLRAALADGARGVISLGLGGGLDPELAVGDVVIASRVISPDGDRETDPAWTARLAAALPDARVAPVYGADVMVLAAREKARLRAESGAAVVDMESRVASGLAGEYAVPFAALRVVSDVARADLPPAVLAGMRPDGGMNLFGVLGALARDPSQLAALMRVGRDAEAAFKALAAAAGGALLEPSPPPFAGERAG
jgi:adenosylhomocysteine nucleosidase